ncbi:hypothetical protein OS188_07180 [Xanthomarina sp. F1114]|uniref:hypothetical protein n=1 Tax=Xanthomarina sp. F1114 TaxID=2996019 RepID=UPI00225E45BA|nr:hypothetical protein [Xanthomarina sp. F1114]MCX7547729.1 hypothetical protein [Xanthomarina sp. F1114]
MTQEKRKTVIIAGSVLFVLIAGYFITQYIVKSKIESFLTNKLPDTVELTYSDLTISLLRANLEITNVHLTNSGKTVDKPNGIVQLEKLSVSGLGYWGVLANNLISIEEISLEKPKVTYYHNPLIPEEEYKFSQSGSFDKDINIKEFNLDKGQIRVLDFETDSLKLQTENIDLKLEKIVYNKSTKKHKIPIDFKNYHMSFTSFFAQMGTYENVRIKSAKVNDKLTKLTDVSMLTKYSRENLSQIIPVERDHYNLNIDSLTIKKPLLETASNSKLHFLTKQIDFYQPVFKVYRDKLVADDESIKPLYSKMLRDLNFDLTVENIKIHEGFISYEEKVKADKKAGLVSFADFNGDFSQVSNTYLEPTKTVLNINTLFMEQTPLHVVWTFDVNNPSDLFEFRAEMGELQASYLNSFTKSNLNVRVEGQLDKTYFTISGTDDLSDIDFKVKYKAFDIIALQEDGKEKNKFLSDVINIFVSTNSQSGDDIFKEVTKTNIERQKTQSVFNFIWISTRAGLLKAMTF